MKIAISVEKENEDVLICPTAGRAPYYILFENKKKIKFMKNPFAVGGGGAGLGVVQMLYNENVDMIISGKFGENMIVALEEKGMKSKVVINKTLKEVLEDLEK